GYAVVMADDGEISALGMCCERADVVLAEQVCVVPRLGGRPVAFTYRLLYTKPFHNEKLPAKNNVRQAETQTHQTAIAD
ncbi:hypothetical protein ACQWFV_24960, partial [Salmonella enterica subsp. enterica serovar Infantis]